jgi:hypothetical protein
MTMDGMMRFARNTLLATVGAALSVAVLPGAALAFATPPAGKAPVIESVSISHLTPTDATLEAQIDTEDLETEYAFQLWSSPCSKKGSGCELIREVKLPSGASLYPSSVPQSVSLDLNSVGVTLGTGEYGFSVTAENEAGHTSAFGGVFEAPSGVFEPLGPTVTPGPGSQTPVTPNDSDQSAGSGDSASTTLGASGAIGGSSKTGAGKTGGKPKAKRGKHHKHEHHGTKAAKHPAESKKHKR